MKFAMTTAVDVATGRMTGVGENPAAQEAVDAPGAIAGMTGVERPGRIAVRVRTEVSVKTAARPVRIADLPVKIVAQGKTGDKVNATKVVSDAIRTSSLADSINNSRMSRNRRGSQKKRPAGVSRSVEAAIRTAAGVRR